MGASLRKGRARVVAVLVAGWLVAALSVSLVAPPADAAVLLRPGARGPAVVALQRRLSTLGYWLGRADGIFGPVTEQAVFALQKAAGIGRDGIVGPRTRAALARGVVTRPRSTKGHVVEIDLRRQLLLVVTNGRLVVALNTSTGGGYRYTEDGATYRAITPLGHFRIEREVNGLVRAPLGELWRPTYFVGGVAIHGYPEVPPVPVSHGCVRVSNAAIDWLWARHLVPVGTAVWVY